MVLSFAAFFDKVHNREVIWQADPAYWKRHAPVLFPNVGRHFEDHYRINGVEYPSSQHGFARDSEFTCVDMTADSITHSRNLLMPQEKIIHMI